MEDDEKNNENWMPTAIKPFTSQVVHINEPTLRDQFAMAALTGLLSNSEACRSGEEPMITYLARTKNGGWLAGISYTIADAMLKAREMDDA